MCNDTKEDHSISPELEDTDLQSLTDVELEQMCTSRGFEIVKETDKETGQSRHYSHNDYVDAAKQCLDMEAEMEQILSDNPQLLDDIEAEAKKMREEKERLEQELADTKSKLRIEEGATNTQNAFINKSAHEKLIDVESKDEHPENQSENVAYDEKNEIIDLDAHKERQMTDTPVSDDDGSRGANQESSALKDESFAEDSNPIEESATKDSIINAGDFIQEFRDKITDDFFQLRNLLFPEHLRGPLMDALKPVIRISQNTVGTAYDLLKRYVLIMLDNGVGKTDNKEKEDHVDSETAQS